MVDAGYEMIARLNEKTGAGQTGLLPIGPRPAASRAGFSFNYTYDVPSLRCADAVCWRPAGLAQLAKMNSFFARTGARDQGATLTEGDQ